MKMSTSHVHLHEEVLVIQKGNCTFVSWVTSYAHNEFVKGWLQLWAMAVQQRWGRHEASERSVIPPKKRWVPQWVIFRVTESWCESWNLNSIRVVRGPWPGSNKGVAVQYSILVSGFTGPIQSAIVFIITWGSCVHSGKLLRPEPLDLPLV